MKLNEDVERLVRDAARRSGKSFDETLNEVVRAGLEVRRGKKTFEVKSKPLGLRPGFDPTGFNQLVDDLEVEELRARLQSEARTG